QPRKIGLYRYRVSGCLAGGLCIFQSITGNYNQGSLVRFHYILIARAFETGQCSHSCRFAEYGCPARPEPHRFQYLFIAYTYYISARISQSLQCLAPVARVTDGNAVGYCLGPSWLQLLTTTESLYNWTGSLCLRSKHSRKAAGNAKPVHLVYPFPRAGYGAAVTDRKGYPIGHQIGHLLTYFEAHCLFAFDQIWIDGGVSVIPAPTLTGTLA